MKFPKADLLPFSSVGDEPIWWATWKELFSFSRNWWQKKSQHP